MQAQIQISAPRQSPTDQFIITSSSRWITTQLQPPHKSNAQQPGMFAAQLIGVMTATVAGTDRPYLVADLVSELVAVLWQSADS
jgi:hypothetical protein